MVNLLFQHGSRPVSMLKYVLHFEKYRHVCDIQKFAAAAFSSQINYANGQQPFLDTNQPISLSHSKVIFSPWLHKQSRQASGTVLPDKKTKALAVIKDLKELRASPTPALVLGFSGLVPFVAAPVFIVSQDIFDPSVAYAQAAYGACILSFLGGIRWGFTLTENSVQQPTWRNLSWSVAPSLVAWIGLLMPLPLTILSVIGGLGVLAYLDLIFFGYPMWFKALRFCLTLVAVLSLWTTLVCSILMHSKKKQK